MILVSETRYIPEFEGCSHPFTMALLFHNYIRSSHIRGRDEGRAMKFWRFGGIFFLDLSSQLGEKSGYILWGKRTKKSGTPVVFRQTSFAFMAGFPRLC